MHLLLSLPLPPCCRGPEYQAEVGLLSRYILIQGDASAERSRRGPHIRVEGSARIRGVQADRAGQARGRMVGCRGAGGEGGRREQRLRRGQESWGNQCRGAASAVACPALHSPAGSPATAASASAVSTSSLARAISRSNSRCMRW